MRLLGMVKWFMVGRKLLVCKMFVGLVKRDIEAVIHILLLIESSHSKERKVSRPSSKTLLISLDVDWH